MISNNITINRETESEHLPAKNFLEKLRNNAQ